MPYAYFLKLTREQYITAAEHDGLLAKLSAVAEGRVVEIEIEAEWDAREIEASVTESQRFTTTGTTLTIKSPSGLDTIFSAPIIRFGWESDGPETFVPPTLEIGHGYTETGSGVLVPPQPQPSDFIALYTWNSINFNVDMQWLDGITAVVTGAHDTTISGTIKRIVPGLVDAQAICPRRGCERSKPKPLDSAIIHLNDHHKWTRESIADWLDTLEDVDLTVHREREAVDA